MPAQECMNLNKKQAELLVGCRRRLLREVGVLIAEWDSLWAQLQVVAMLPAPQVTLTRL